MSQIVKANWNKWYFCVSALFLLIPCYTWRRYFKTVKKLRNKSHNVGAFYEQHNCVVTYAREKGMAGWIQNKSRIKVDVTNCELLFEPLLNFLRTSQTTLDIAVMVITITRIPEVLLELHKKGVKIRIITEHRLSQENEYLKHLESAGIQIRYFVYLKTEGESIMHHKFAIKDCFEDSGYVLFGSINWSMSGFTNNYEDLVLTSAPAVVKQFSNHFQNVWDFLGTMCNDKHVKAVLSNKFLREN